MSYVTELLFGTKLSSCVKKLCVDLRATNVKYKIYHPLIVGTKVDVRMT